MQAVVKTYNSPELARMSHAYQVGVRVPRRFCLQFMGERELDMVKAATQNEGEGKMVPQVAETSLSNEMMRA